MKILCNPCYCWILGRHRLRQSLVLKAEKMQFARDARDIEADQLTRCVEAAKSETAMANDYRDANVFNVAALVLRSRFPVASANLGVASEQYFALYPVPPALPPADVVSKGWVFGLSRLRDMLGRMLTDSGTGR